MDPVAGMSNSIEVAKCEEVLARLDRLDCAEAVEPLFSIGGRMANTTVTIAAGRKAAQRSKRIWGRQLMSPSVSQETE